jgi:hypothetical protein
MAPTTVLLMMFMTMMMSTAKLFYHGGRPSPSMLPFSHRPPDRATVNDGQQQPAPQEINES